MNESTYFSFGVLAFELLTDRLPYPATNSTTTMLQRLNTEPLDAAEVKPKLSDELCDVLRKLTARSKTTGGRRWPPCRRSCARFPPNGPNPRTAAGL